MASGTTSAPTAQAPAGSWLASLQNPTTPATPTSISGNAGITDPTKAPPGSTVAGSTVTNADQSTKFVPTVLSDTNIRENVIPQTIQQANNAVNSSTPASSGSATANTTGSSAGTTGTSITGASTGTTGASTGTSGTGSGTSGSTGGATPTDASTMSYEDLYNKTMSDLNGQPLDPVTQSELTMLNSMMGKTDAQTQSQLDTITQAYAERQSLLQEAQASQTATVSNALTLGGGSRYAPISSSGVLSAKERYDLATVSDLQNEENSAKATVIKAGNDQDFETQGKALDILNSIRDEKTTLAGKIADSMISQNESLRSYQLQQKQFAETQKKDAADIQHQNISDKIAAADLGLRKTASNIAVSAENRANATWNATYGQFLNPDGTPAATTPQNIPGMTKLSNGSSVIDLSQIPSELQSSIKGLASKAGLHIVAPADMPIFTSATNLSSSINQAQALYAKLNSGKGTSDDQNQYNNLVTQINDSMLKLGGDDRFSSISKQTVPVYDSNPIAGFFGANSLTKANSTFDSIRESINSGLSSTVPNYIAPKYGQTFSSTNDLTSWAQSTGNGADISNIIDSATTALKENDPNYTPADLEATILAAVNGN